MKFKDIMFILSSILLLLGAFMYTSWIDNSIECINSDDNNPETCLRNFILFSPMIKEVKDIEKSCKESDTRCLLKFGEKTVENKIENFENQENN
tara:strand:+ start:1535 stop:1816 length:282 start_codon:yes stop_codon:yes gene_type:complete